MTNTGKKRFSIIIPCYNAEDYVDRALESAVRQSFDKNNYEIIAVNDASTDGTLQKLYRWQEKYPELISVITYEVNLRQGGARNRAMKEAKGEYICFLDADDRLSISCLDTYNNIIEITGADMVVSKHIDENELVYPNYDVAEAFDLNASALNVSSSSASEKGLIRDESKIEKIYKNDKDIKKIILSDFGYVWCAAYRRDIIIENDIMFPEHLAYEDIYWPRIYRLYAKTICVCNEVTHYRYNNPVSTMNKKNAAHHLDRLTVCEKLLSKYGELDVLKNHYDELFRETMEIYYFNSYYMFFTRMDEIPDVYMRIRNEIYKFFPDWDKRYDDSYLPEFFRYMVKLLKRAVNVKPSELIPFKEALLEIIG